MIDPQLIKAALWQRPRDAGDAEALRRLSRAFIGMAWVNVVCALAFQPTIFILSRSFSESAISWVIRAQCGAFFSIALMCLIFRRFVAKYEQHLQWVVVGAYVSFFAVYVLQIDAGFANMAGYFQRLAGQNVVSIIDMPTRAAYNDSLTSGAVFLAAIAVLVAISPLQFRRNLWLGAAYLVGGLYAFRSAPDGLWEIGLILGICVGLSVRAVGETLAFIGYRTTVLHEETVERHARAKYELELELAREIQTSMNPPARLLVGSLDIRCHSAPHHLVGGDWLAVRSFSADEAIVVVADAAGKGLQAALVVHAVQSLWALSDAKVFDPHLWINQVNKALIELGRKQTHSMSLALLHLQPTVATLWSAGHCPLMWRTTGRPNGEGGQEPSYREIYAHGSILGVSANLDLRPTLIALPHDLRFRAVLCTDGVLEQLPRSRVGRASFMDGLDGRLDSQLRELKTDDDQTLIVVEKTGRAKVDAA